MYYSIPKACVNIKFYACSVYVWKKEKKGRCVKCEMKCMLAYNYEKYSTKLKIYKTSLGNGISGYSMMDNFFLKREIIIQRKHKTKLSVSEPGRGESFAKIYII